MEALKRPVRCVVFTAGRVSLAILDALNERHLKTQGEVLRDVPLVSSASGL